MLFAGASLSLAAPGDSRPGPADATPIELAPFQVEVSSDLWATPLARLPASVSVYDDAALRAAAARHFGDLVDGVPNLTTTGGTSRPRYFQIRGIGENSQFEGETPDSSVRFLIDDLDFTGLGGVAGLWDVQRVEVLRGPQAGAFGANAAGGLVRLVTTAPTPVWTGRIEASAGGDALRSVAAAVGGPLAKRRPDEVMMRLAVESTRSDGFRRNVTLGRNTNAREETAGRLRLAWNPDGAWRWQATALIAEGNNGYDEFALDNNGERTFSDRPGRDEQRSQAVALRGERVGTGEVRLTSVTTGTWTDSEYSYDDDWTAASYAGFSDLRRERRVWTQELRLDSEAKREAGGAVGRWTLGGYFAATDEDGVYTNEDPETRRGLATEYRARVGAVFAQAGGELASGTRLIVGLRGERIELEGAGTRTRVSLPGGSAAAPRTIAPRFDDTLLGGRLVLERDLRANLLAFASLTVATKRAG
jgi:iron complex outermembrane recepter protein